MEGKEALADTDALANHSLLALRLKAKAGARSNKTPKPQRPKLNQQALILQLAE